MQRNKEIKNWKHSSRTIEILQYAATLKRFIAVQRFPTLISNLIFTYFHCTQDKQTSILWLYLPILLYHSMWSKSWLFPNYPIQKRSVQKQMLWIWNPPFCSFSLVVDNSYFCKVASMLNVLALINAICACAALLVSSLVAVSGKVLWLLETPCSFSAE